MAKARAVPMSRAAQVGLIALAFLSAGALGVFFAAKFVRGVGGYDIGVRFPQAAGVAPGAQVFLNGVTIGSVNKVTILPDASVDFIINIFRDTGIPKNARFTVQTAFTGGSKVIISAPVGSHDFLPRRVLPIAQQPIGTPPLSIDAFMAQSRTLTNRANGMLTEARPYRTHLAYHLQDARAHAAATQAELRVAFPTVMTGLHSTIARAQANARAAQAAIENGNQQKLAAIAASFDRTTQAMQRSQAELAALKRDPNIRSNLRSASVQLQAATKNLAGLSHDMESVTGDPQTKAQLRDAAARLRALLKRL